MASMYEMLMDLPLFKGVGKDQISNFLEKTNINFLNYHDTEILVECGDPVKMVRFVMTGRVRIIHPLKSAAISVEEIAGFGRVLGAERLFGMTTGFPYRTVSLGKTSIMEFSKEQYVNLLHSDRIYMLNFFNYLSLRAQRPIEAICDYGDGGIRSRLSLLIGIMTSPGSNKIYIKASDEALSRYCSTDEGTLARWKRDMEDSGVVECTPLGIRILSRAEFL